MFEKKNKKLEKPLELGKVNASKDALEAFQKAEVYPNWFLEKHKDCDWDETSENDQLANNSTLNGLGSTILSTHTLPRTGEKIMILTETDKEETTLLMPDEY